MDHEGASAGGERPGHSSPHRLVVLAGVLAGLVAGVGYLLLAEPGPEDAVERYVESVQERGCGPPGGDYAVDRPDDLAGPLDVCRRGGGDLVLEDVRVTAIEESPSGLAVPAGASEVARVAYEAETSTAGASTTYDGALVVALVDGEWGVVDDDAT